MSERGKTPAAPKLIKKEKKKRLKDKKAKLVWRVGPSLEDGTVIHHQEEEEEEESKRGKNWFLSSEGLEAVSSWRN